MFIRLQFKMTFFFSLILVTILLVTNFVVYIVMINYNRYQLSIEVEALLADIENQTWEYDEDEKEDNNIETKDLEEPSSLNSFSVYIVYSREDEIVNFHVDDKDVWPTLKEVSLSTPELVAPSVVKLSAPNEGYYLVAKRPITINNQDLGCFFVGKNVTIAYETLENLLFILVVSTVLGSIISVVLGYFIAGKSIKPIKEAYETKQVFLANVSHELRTPLSVILLSSNILESEVDESQVFQHDIVNDIKEEAIKMNGLIENLLLLSRSDNNKMIAAIEKINLSELVEKGVASFRTLIEQKKLQLSTEIETNINFEGDIKLLRSVISILVDNAIKYSHEGGNLWVSLSKIKNHHTTTIRFSVKDSGIGIPEAELKQIFERFYRIEGSRSKKTGGYGLGLSIAKDIVELHRGQIEVKSRVDEGSEFIVTFEQSDM